MAVGLPVWALKEEVTVEFIAEIPNQTGTIDEFTDHHIVLGTKLHTYLIPWTAIAYLWIPVKKQIPTEE